jgi:predicted regulator of Ras-like GTPase activity (Roadblock/LC7/MglB family)
VDPAQALADVTEISSQIEAVVLLNRDGTMLASNVDDAATADRIAQGVVRLLEEAAAASPRAGEEVAQAEAATPDGSVFVVRDGGRIVGATTGREPTVGLVFYDLRSCLRSLDEADA